MKTPKSGQNFVPFSVKGQVIFEKKNNKTVQPSSDFGAFPCRSNELKLNIPISVVECKTNFMQLNALGQHPTTMNTDLGHLKWSKIWTSTSPDFGAFRIMYYINVNVPNILAKKAKFHFVEFFFQDVRVPCTPVARLNNHRACVNGIAWAPHSSCHICTAGIRIKM